MPWAGPTRPSIQLSLLKGAAENAGFRVDLHHLYLELARSIGSNLYHALAARSLVGEWLFGMVFDPGKKNETAYSDFCSKKQGLEAFLPDWASVLHMVDACEQFVRDVLESRPWGDYELVGFSSMFDQTLASLCLARGIKETNRNVSIVFGGANVDGSQGPALQEAFPFVDYCLRGEGEEAFPRLLNALFRNSEAIDLVPGLSFFSNGSVATSRQKAIVEDLDTTPIPDYSDYFRELRQLKLADKISPAIMMETSRGCWFGRCLFCGLNREAIQFRSKSPQRALQELEVLVRSTCTLSVYMLDNILDLKYLDTLLPAVSQLRSEGDFDVAFFYEIKANVRRRDVATMARAGFVKVQPGVESFSTRTLKLMQKGSTAFHNIQVLKWCQEFGIHPLYNVLHGFLGQTSDDLRRESELLSKITHLHPPMTFSRVRLERFSPYFEQPEAYGFTGVRPDSLYRHIYPSHADLSKIAYTFAYELNEPPEQQEVYEQERQTLERAIEEWRSTFVRGRLLYWKGPDFVKIRDWRLQGSEKQIVLTEQAAELYVACEESQPLRAVADRISRAGKPLDDRTVDWLVKEDLLFVEGGRALSLAVHCQRQEWGAA